MSTSCASFHSSSHLCICTFDVVILPYPDSTTFLRSLFISQADNFQLLYQAVIIISDTTEAVVELRLQTWARAVGGPSHPPLRVGNRTQRWVGWASSGSGTSLCQGTESSPPSSLSLSTLERLTISGYQYWWPAWGNRWLEFLPAFTAVKNLYLNKDVASDLFPVLKDVTGESTTEVLPALQDLF